MRPGSDAPTALHGALRLARSLWTLLGTAMALWRAALVGILPL